MRGVRRRTHQVDDISTSNVRERVVTCAIVRLIHHPKIDPLWIVDLGMSRSLGCLCSLMNRNHQPTRPGLPTKTHGLSVHTISNHHTEERRGSANSTLAVQAARRFFCRSADCVWGGFGFGVIFDTRKGNCRYNISSYIRTACFTNFFSPATWRAPTAFSMIIAFSRITRACSRMTLTGPCLPPFSAHLRLPPFSHAFSAYLHPPWKMPR